MVDGKALAHWLAALGSTDLLATILAPPHAVHADAVCYDGHTPLHAAAAHGHVECVRMLLAKGADAEIADGAGRMPIAHALRGVPLRGLEAGEGHAECYALLLRHLAR